MGISENIFSLYIEDMIRQASNTQDTLNEVCNRLIAGTEPSGVRDGGIGDA